MFHLLHPAALWTLAALALPLAIHLWRPPPRTVRLGSLRFLENAPRSPLRNLRWRELVLLWTRLGLLVALSFLLAEPHWFISPPAGPRRWALLDPTAAPTGESLAQWHKARAAGYELHRLAPGFPVAADDPAPIADSGSSVSPDLWSLLREADAELPGGSTLAVYSPARLTALRGIRPALAHCTVEWVRTPDDAGNAAHTWVALAADNRAVEGRSDARATEFTVKPPGDPAALRPAVAPALSVLILHDAEHLSDARYLEAAVRAAAESTAHPVNLQSRDITPDADNAAVTDWTFWLSTRPVPDGLAAHAPRILRYAGGVAVAAGEWIVAPSGDTADGARLWRRATPTPQSPAGVAWWSDGQGDPVLTYSHPAAGERWELYTRFEPAWTDLPRTTSLPAWVRALLFPEDAARADAGPVHDRRLADPSQCLPSDAAAVATIPVLASVDQPSKDLHWPLWTLAAVLFAAERVLSLRRSAAPSALTPVRPEPAAAASR